MEIKTEQEKDQTKPIKKIKLTEYHSIDYLKKKRKQLKEEVVFILPNGKEISL